MQIGRKEAQAAVEKLSKATGFPDLVAQLEQEPSSEAGNPATPTIDIDLLTTNSEWTAEERQAYVRAILAELPPADQEYACSDLKTFHSYSIGHELEVNPLLGKS